VAAADTLNRLLARHGRTYADEAGITLRNRPAPLFQLLVLALLLSARISDRIAVAAARALFGHGCTDARRMADATWQQPVGADGAGPNDPDAESTSTYLGETAELVLDRYDGDLRRLRRRADGDPATVARLLQECKGIGRLGADIFCREAQRVWPELRPFADRAALKVAADLGLPDAPDRLARLHGDDDLTVVSAALLRAKLSKDLDVLRRGDDAAAPTDTQLATMTRGDLYDLARQIDVAGRSAMNRAELEAAVRDATS
jgi:hypothetical protein